MALKPVERIYSTSSNGGSSVGAMDEALHLPDSLPTKQHWREVWRAVWYRFQREWEPVVVNKQIESVTVPKWIAIAFLTALLGFGVQSWWRASDQREMLIELKTEVRMSKEFEAERSRQLKEQGELTKVYIDNVTSQLNVIKGMLSQQQLNAVEAAKKGSN